VKTKNIRQSAGILQSRESVKLKIIIKTALLLCVFCGSVFAQKPKIAVYVAESNSLSRDQKSALRTAALNTLVNSNRYEVVERSNVIETELQRQSSGEIDEDQVTAFGRQLGAQYICIAEMVYLRHGRVNDGTAEQPRWRSTREHLVSARIINIETAEVVALGAITANIQSGADLPQAVNRAVSKMLDTVRPSSTDLPRIAVYVQRGAQRRVDAEQALYTSTLEALFLISSRRGDFIVVERSEAFTAQINKEHGAPQSDHVREDQIARMGRQFGVGHIAIISMEYAMSSHNISTRLVNIETASVERASQVYSQSDEFNDLRDIAFNMARSIIAKNEVELEHDRKVKEAQKRAEAKETRNLIIWSIIALVGLGVWIALDPGTFGL